MENCQSLCNLVIGSRHYVRCSARSRLIGRPGRDWKWPMSRIAFENSSFKRNPRFSVSAIAHIYLPLAVHSLMSWRAIPTSPKIFSESFVLKNRVIATSPVTMPSPFVSACLNRISKSRSSSRVRFGMADLPVSFGHWLARRLL